MKSQQVPSCKGLRTAGLENGRGHKVVKGQGSDQPVFFW